MRIEEWRERGQLLRLPEGSIFMIELGVTTSSPRLPLLALHGFPTSCWDFAAVATKLAGERRVVLFDFLGFGLSDKPADAGYSLFEQADVATLVARTAGLTRCHVWAHDMGTSIATELLARRERSLLPFDVASLTLMNGSVHQELAHLTLGQRLLRSPLGSTFAHLSTKSVFFAQMRRIFGRRPADVDLEGMWTLVERGEGVRRLVETIRYVDERSRFATRWIGALERLDVPALVAWGVRDPVARMTIADRLAREIPDAERVTWNELGHYPHVEDPEKVSADVGAFLRRHDRM